MTSTQYACGGFLRENHVHQVHKFTSTLAERGVTLEATDRGTIRVINASLLQNQEREFIREHKAELLAALSCELVNIVNFVSGENSAHALCAAERQAIQWESEQPLDPDPTGCGSVPGFDDITPITDAERFAMNMALLKEYSR